MYLPNPKDMPFDLAAAVVDENPSEREIEFPVTQRKQSIRDDSRFPTLPHIVRFDFFFIERVFGLRCIYMYMRRYRWWACDTTAERQRVVLPVAQRFLSVKCEFEPWKNTTLVFCTTVPNRLYRLVIVIYCNVEQKKNIENVKKKYN